LITMRVVGVDAATAEGVCTTNKRANCASTPTELSTSTTTSSSSSSSSSSVSTLQFEDIVCGRSYSVFTLSPINAIRYCTDETTKWLFICP
jgi:hypothetical protein